MTLQLKQVTKKYFVKKNDYVVIDNLSINFPKNGLVGIVGQSGSGKSTLLNMIAGIEKPSSGQIIIDGYELSEFDLNLYRHNYISYIYQNNNLIPALTAKENIRLLLEIKHKSSSINKIGDWKKELELEGLLEKFPFQLSGGQCQRISILRAFLCNTPILLADEPTAALNCSLKEKVMRLLKMYAQNHLVIVISHDRSLLQSYTKMIVDLDSGENYYNFGKKSYHKYLIPKKTARNKLFFYFLRQISYQKKKIIMVLCTQIFIIAAFVLLISGINGGRLHLQNKLSKDPLKNIVELTKKDLVENEFNSREIDKLGIHHLVQAVGYKYDLAWGEFKHQYNCHQLIGDFSAYIAKGRDITGINEVLINQKAAKKYRLSVGKNIEYILAKEKYCFKIVGIIDDRINLGENIYFKGAGLDETLQNLVINQAVLLVKTNEVKQLINFVDKDYNAINMHLEYIDTSKTLLLLAIVVSAVFLSVSFIISIILISIMLKTILIERKKEVCLILMNGCSKLQAKWLFVKESAVMGILIGSLGAIFSSFIIVCIRGLKLEEYILGVKNFFVLPTLFMSRYDMYLILIVIYGLVCIFSGISACKKINKMDMSILLKDDY